jgi:hypothetical protein
MTTTPPIRRRPVSQFFAGTATFAAGALLLTCALLTLFLGLSALVDDGHLVVIGPHYVYMFNATGWGWGHIALAIAMGAVAFGLFFGSFWARVAAIVMASLSIVVMFLWLPYFPVWSMVVIALDVVIIWAVATWHTSQSGPDIPEPAAPER